MTYVTIVKYEASCTQVTFCESSTLSHDKLNPFMEVMLQHNGMTDMFEWAPSYDEQGLQGELGHQ